MSHATSLRVQTYARFGERYHGLSVSHSGDTNGPVNRGRSKELVIVVVADSDYREADLMSSVDKVLLL